MLRIVGMLACSVDGADGNAVDGVGVAVKVAVIITGRTIPTRKDVNRTQPTTALLDGFEHSSPNQHTRCLHRTTVVTRAPRTRVDLVLVVFVHHGLCFVGIADGLTQNSNASNLGFVRNTEPTDIVANGRNLSSTSGTVSIVG